MNSKITDEQLRAMMGDAGQAGDAVQVHLCAIALGLDESEYMSLDEGEEARVERLSHGRNAEWARRSVELTIESLARD